MFEFEQIYQKQGKTLIAGIDEAGRGPLAGPVCVACVIMPLDKDKIIDKINDSKKLSAKMREQLYLEIIQNAISYDIEMIDESTIDAINILNATKLGMLTCLNKISIKPEITLIDAVEIASEHQTHSIIKGDMLSYSIACASILAKVTRDRYMTEMDKLYPEYNFKQHKGYATKEHIDKLLALGKCDIHRDSFIKNFQRA